MVLSVGADMVVVGAKESQAVTRPGLGFLQNLTSGEP